MAKKTKKRPSSKGRTSSKKKAARRSVKKKTVKRSNKKSTPKKVVSEKKSVSINPYLTFNGTCEAAFNFYRSVFGGNFPYIGRFKEMPPAEGQPPMTEAQANLIMHVSLPIGNNSMLMGSDSSEEFGHASTIGNNYSISINAVTQAEADKLFHGLSSGGKITMPIGKTFWGAYFGMLTDKFGIQWMVNFDMRPM